MTNFILDEIKRPISISVYYVWKRSIKKLNFGGDLLQTWLCIESDVFFNNPQWNFMCYYTNPHNSQKVPKTKQTTKKKISTSDYLRNEKITTITNFILDEIKRPISISVYYGWKRSIKNGADEKSALNLFFDCRFHTLHARENIWNLTSNVYLISIFSITTSRYQRHIIVWCLIYINTYLI
jgi:hypothetical protein